MRGNTISYALLLALVMLFLSIGLTYGTNTTDERTELNKVQEEINKKQQELEQGKQHEKTLLGQMQALENQVRLTQVEIDTLRGSINSLQANIESAQADLDELEGQLSVQNDALNARLRAMYINGNVGILDVLLGSSSISDFMTNMDRIQLIYESDKEVIESLEEQFRIVDTQKQYLQRLQADLVAEREREAGKRETLKNNQQAVNAKKTEVAANNKMLEQMIDSLFEEANALIAKIIAMQSDSEYVGGNMGWPVPGASRITSEFGYRVHPILKTKKMHTGIDIACPTGTKVVASNAGRVIMSGWNDSYGYVVVVDHGGGRTTLYAHNSSLLVSEGEIVMRGQQIAKSGSTGMSTGPHLHYEVRINGEYKNPREYL